MIIKVFPKGIFLILALSLETLEPAKLATEERKAYQIRLLMQLLNVEMETKIRQKNDLK